MDIADGVPCSSFAVDSIIRMGTVIYSLYFPFYTKPNQMFSELIITAGWLNLGFLFWSLRRRQIRYYTTFFSNCWIFFLSLSVSYSDIWTGLAGIHRASFIVSCSMTPHCNAFLFGLLWLFCVFSRYMQAKSVGRFGFQWGNQNNFLNLILI